MARQKLVAAVVCTGRPTWDADALRRLRQVVDIALLARRPQADTAATPGPSESTESGKASTP